MAKGKIGGKIVLEGEKEYRQALKDIKSDQAELRSEMKLCQSEYKNSQNSIQALTAKHEILSKQIESQTSKISVYQKAIQTSAENEEKASKKIAELQTALNLAEQEFKDMSKSSDTTSEALEEQGKTVEELKKKLYTAEDGYDKATQKTKSYQTALNYAQAELKNMESELDSTEKYLKEAKQSTDGCAKSIDEFGKETQQATDKTNVFGDVLKANLASEAIINGVKRLAEGIKQCAESSIEVGTEFEASMSQVAATMGMTADEINSGSKEYEKLASTAKQCGATTKYSASESGEALNYLALAGYDVEKSVATLPKVLDLASAGGLDLAYSSDLVTDSMAALGLETKDLDKYIDEMAKTSQKSNTSVAQLGEATLVCAGTVSMTGQSLETMNAELGILANNGLKGAEGGTHLRNILLSLSAPTDTAAISIEQLGLRIADSKGNMRDLNDIMIDLNAALSGMSSTEKTQIVKKIFNKTDIAAVNALLKGTNGEFDSLNKEIGNCAGAAKNMADTMNNNLKGKLTILKSSLEALGIAAYEVFDDDMKTAVDGATNAVGRLQQSIETGDLGVSLNRMSDALSEFFENAVDVGEDALPKLIDGFTWILENGDLIVSVISGIVTANVTMNTIVPAVKSAHEAWILYKTTTEGATVSQWLLNTAMESNPAGALATAVIAVTSALASYVLINKDSIGGMTESAKKTNELIDKNKELLETYKNNTSAREKSKGTIEAEAILADSLVEELKELADKTELTTSEQFRMQQIVGELNEIFPELNLAIDENTGLLNMSTEALDSNVDAMMNQMRIAEYEEQCKDIMHDLVEAELELNELRKERAEQDKILAEHEKLVSEAVGDSILLSIDTEPIVAAGEAIEKLDKQITEAEESVGTLSNEYTDMYTLFQETESLVKSETAIDSLGNAADETGDQLELMSDEAIEASKNMKETIEKQISLFSEFSGEVKLSTTEILSNMQSQVNGINDWATNIETLSDRGINKGLLKTLAEMGPEGAGYVAAFVQMTDEELNKAGELFEEAMKIPDNVTDRVTETYIGTGENAGEGFCEGIKNKTEDAAEAAGEMGTQSLEELDKALDINSPSKETEKRGEYYTEGFISGVNNKKNALLETISSLAKSLLQTIDNDLPQSSIIKIGEEIPNGIARGIEKGESKAIRAASRMARKALEAAKKELDINSPSKKFEYLGDMSGEGYIKGWQETMADIDNIVAQSLPDTSMIPATTTTPINGNQKVDTSTSYEINQQINIYEKTPDLFETALAFKDAQKEAALEW